MRDLTCNNLHFDELWGFIGKKERHVQPTDNPQLGDVWTFCALDADTELIPSFKVAKRTAQVTQDFVKDVAGRIKNKPHISTDGFRKYVEAVEMAFRANVDYGMIIKTYSKDPNISPERSYSAPDFVSVHKEAITGWPQRDSISTSYIERANGTTRQHMKRLARLTYAFSKKLENFQAAVALHFAYYNLVRTHGTLKMTPAMAAGVERSFWTVADLVEAAQ
jgi:IS1 family transposase